METKLEDLSIADLKALVDYSKKEKYELENNDKIQLEGFKTTFWEYWDEVYNKSRLEISIRIGEIFK